LSRISCLLAGLVLAGCLSPPSPVNRARAPVESATAQPSAPAPKVAPENTVMVAPRTVPGTVIVGPGETLFGIARARHVPIRGLIEANGLEPPYAVTAGQVLKLPGQPAYVVRAGDTLYRIAKCHGVEPVALARANGIAPPYAISPGRGLRLPPPTETPACPPEATAPTTEAPPDESQPMGPIQAHIPAGPGGPVPPPPPRQAAKFLWPVSGNLISGFGPKGGKRHNDGINIGAPAGTPVRAAEAGVVVYAGNQLRAYGNLILVLHADGWTTAYGHNGALLVGRGALVERGQVIARVGASGNVGAPQSHFELRRGATAVDPVKHLSWE
jgi:murein DD-endopeptidase MepM/ murein hydrolase activator NlpD